MPLIKDENEVKRQSQFLEYETGDGGNSLMIKSHLYQIDKHFLQSVSRSVVCRGEECVYCAANYQKGAEYNYMVNLNGAVGYIDIKPSVFFAIQSVAKAQKRDIREMSWTVIKKGEGLLTKYTTSKDDNLSAEAYQLVQSELESNTEKLVSVMERHEEDLDQNYTQFLKDVREQKKPKVEKKETESEVVPESVESGEVVNPDEIPF